MRAGRVTPSNTARWPRSGALHGALACVLALACGSADRNAGPLPPPPGPTGVTVAPGQNLQSLVHANEPGTTYIIEPGRHVRQSVEPNAGDIFRCRSGAILDGENAVEYAFHARGPSRPNVHIVGCIVEHYRPPAQMGAILAGGHSAAEGTVGWVLDSCEIRYNANLGVRLGDGMQIRRSKLHHNGTLGIGGQGRAVVIEGNEIAYNNYQHVGVLGFEAGGTKFVLTDGLVVRDNWVHHNEGPGIWTDIGNVNTLIEENRVEDNRQEGIVHEVSYSAIIRRNQVRRNGLQDPRRLVWPWAAGIGVHASTDVEVYENVVEGNAHGIVAIQQARGSGNLGPYEVRNLWVHDNTIVMQSGLTGVVQDIGSPIIFLQANNRFTGNTYHIAGNVHPFAWLDGVRTELEWKAYGQDTNGLFVR